MRYIYVILTILMLSLVCNAESSPNVPPTLPASPNTALTQPPSLLQALPPIQTGLKVPPPPTMSSDEIVRAERDAYKEIVKAHQETLTTIKWAIGIIGSLILVLVGYVVFKNNKEYKDALEQAKEARNDAKEACKEARHWESESKQILESIDKQVKEELENIKKQSQEAIQDISNQTQKEALASKLWNDALGLHNEGKYGEASDKYAEVVKLKPDMYEAYFSWGYTLADWAEIDGNEELFKEACDKYADVVKLKPDMYEAYNNWGYALTKWAQLKSGKPEYTDLLNQAEEKGLKAESLKKGSSAYNLACVYALKGNMDECRKWLLIGRKTGTLPTRETVMEDKDLDIVRNEDWFKEIKWKGEK